MAEAERRLVDTNRVIVYDGRGSGLSDRQLFTNLFYPDGDAFMRGLFAPGT